MLRHALRQPLWLLLFAALAVSAVSALVERSNPCGDAGRVSVVAGMTLCTHGADTPPGVANMQSLPETTDLLHRAASPLASQGVACVGDGQSGPRVQVVYARAASTPDRFTAVLPAVRMAAASTDAAIHVSATKRDAGRRVRFVTTPDCTVDVVPVELSDAGDDSFDATIAELQRHGFTRPDRKYLVFMDAAVGLCGQGHLLPDDRPAASNVNNGTVAMFARIDTACWTASATHELLHMLGAVQHSAPHSSGSGHCVDEADVMCYADTSTTQTLRVCGHTYVKQVDCNHDDYFDPNPPAGSYLATHWNVADSSFLEPSEALPPPRGALRLPRSIPARTPVAVSAEMDVAYGHPASYEWTTSDDRCRFANHRAPEARLRCRGESRWVVVALTVTDVAGQQATLRQITQVVRPAR